MTSVPKSTQDTLNREETVIGNQRNRTGSPIFRVPPESLSESASADDDDQVNTGVAEEDAP